MIKFMQIVTLLLVALVSTAACAATEAAMKQEAMRGDYQAQRNLAYSYATGWGTPQSPNFIAKKPVDACAWYRVIAVSTNPKVQTGDYSNEWTYCSKLSPDQSEAAWLLAKRLIKQVSAK
ncbi:hypothetical protein [Aquitalea magnusonii]|uniref:hypothetical protein n=1 Tax=Aquitalea magnusonii TaxID=332411 RepID=UPI0011AEA35F|nr:hypothetical protein [Aquitalea magnusonii]